MKKCIVARKIDNLYRVVIPNDFRKELNIKRNDYIDLQLVDNKTILIQKHNFSASYEELLRNALIETKGLNIRNVFISKDVLKEFEIEVKNFIKKHYK